MPNVAPYDATNVTEQRDRTPLPSALDCRGIGRLLCRAARDQKRSPNECRGLGRAVNNRVERRKRTLYGEHTPGWPMEWQNCPFWQTVFAGPQAHGPGDGCSALQDIAGGLGLATCRPFASATPTDMAIARKATAKVFSIISSSLDDAGGWISRWSARTCGRGQNPKVRAVQILRNRPLVSFATGLFSHEVDKTHCD